jgi:outer membrane protein W
LGFGIPLGKTTGDDTALEFSNKFPIWLDLGYRITPSILVGLYGQYAPATLKCPTGFFCSGASVMRFGVQFLYGFAPDATFAPWAGLGVGYEIANATLTNAGVERKFDLKGVEFLNLQAGADYMVSKSVGIGPFLSFSLGRYSTGSFEFEGRTESGGIGKKEFHEWLVLGVRGAVSL